MLDSSDHIQQGLSQSPLSALLFFKKRHRSEEAVETAEQRASSLYPPPLPLPPPPMWSLGEVKPPDSRIIL